MPIKSKGFIQCGVSTGLAGFSNPDDAGNWSGLDVDVCRAIAAALFGDAEAVKYTPLTAKERFTALQSGEVDVLSRNTTWTLARDSALGLDFTGVTYYDGQGFMVPKSLGVKSALELDGASVCVQTGTTTELNLADYFRANNMSFSPVVFERPDETAHGLRAGPLRRADHRPVRPLRRAHRPRQPRRAHRPARGDLEGAARAGRAPRRQRMGRRRALDALRHARGRGARRQLGRTSTT